MSIKSKIQALISAANSTTGESDTTLTDAVQTLVDGYGGGGVPEVGGITAVAVDSTTITSVLASFPLLNSLTINSDNSLSIQTVDIAVGNNEVTIHSNGAAAHNGGALKTIDLHGARALVSDATGLRYRANLETVNAKVRVTTSNTANQFTGTTKLKNVLWQENKQTISLNMAACSLLTDDSLVSIANGLSGATTATLTLHSTPKARCASILGAVSQVTDGSDTYDVFTLDDSGTVTLLDFITNTKGWTIT